MEHNFSIIIPVYNVAPYLRECLDSVLAQSYTDWESICVDDGSTDGSGAILDTYVASDSRFRVIHQANAGVSAARNVALDSANGKWVMFLDADDMLGQNALARMMSEAKDGVDVVLMRHTSFDDDAFVEGRETEACQLAEGARVEWAEYYHPIFAAAFRQEVVKDLRFELLTIGEDRVWYLDALDRVKNRVLLDYVGYGYRNREGSAIHSKMTRRKFEDNLKHFQRVCEIVGRRPDRYARNVLRRIGQSLTEYAAMEFSLLSKEDKIVSHKFWIEILNRVKHYSWLIPFQRLVMNVCAKTKFQFVTMVLCYVPFWLKAHGLHR